MDEQIRIHIILSLSTAIEKWWDDLADTDFETASNLPLVGKSISYNMAVSAVSVLAGIDDSQNYLRLEGLLTD